MWSTLGRDAFGKVGKNNLFTAAQPLKAQQIFGWVKTETKPTRVPETQGYVAVWLFIMGFSATREKQKVWAFEDLWMSLPSMNSSAN